MNKTFLITGASAGLGEIFSISIADIAKNIIIVGRNKNRLLRLKKKINKINSKIKVLIVIVDLSKESGVFKLFKQFETQKKIKFVDVLVNYRILSTIKKIEKISGDFISRPFIFNQNLFVIRNGTKTLEMILIK